MPTQCALKVNELLRIGGLNPSKDRVLIMRHRPIEPEMKRILPWIAAEQPKLYKVYHQTQIPSAERMMKRADYLMSFIGHESNRAVFTALYKIGQHRPMTYDEYWAVPENVELRSKGMIGFTGDRQTVLTFDLTLTGLWEQWIGKLIIEWTGGGRTWCRWANRNHFAVLAIMDDSLLEAGMPAWNEMVLSWQQLHTLPNRWRTALREWRGIYYIFDQEAQKGYVGSASGKENLYGRWKNYRDEGHGGNLQLRKRKPENFVFSILERLSPELEAGAVVAAENRWKERLHSRQFGLNDN